MVYQIKCAWCGKAMGTKEGPESNFALRMEKQGLQIISHGMCSDCQQKVMGEIKSKDKGDNKND